jgi:hypothetical protein
MRIRYYDGFVTLAWVMGLGLKFGVRVRGYYDGFVAQLMVIVETVVLIFISAVITHH